MKRDNDRGYLLLEVVLAVAVFTLAALPCVRLAVVAQQQQQRAQGQGIALRIVTSALEKALASPEDVSSFGSHEGKQNDINYILVISRQVYPAFIVIRAQINYGYGDDSDASLFFVRIIPLA